METVELHHGFDMDGDACMYGQVIDDDGNHTRYLDAKELTAHVRKLEAAVEMVAQLKDMLMGRVHKKTSPCTGCCCSLDLPIDLQVCSCKCHPANFLKEES